MAISNKVVNDESSFAHVSNIRLWNKYKENKNIYGCLKGKSKGGWIEFYFAEMF